MKLDLQSILRGAEAIYLQLTQCKVKCLTSARNIITTLKQTNKQKTASQMIKVSWCPLVHAFFPLPPSGASTEGAASSGYLRRLHFWGGQPRVPDQRDTTPPWPTPRRRCCLCLNTWSHLSLNQTFRLLDTYGKYYIYMYIGIDDGVRRDVTVINICQRQGALSSHFFFIPSNMSKHYSHTCSVSLSLCMFSSSLRPPAAVLPFI